MPDLPGDDLDDVSRAVLDARTRAVAARPMLLGRSDRHDALGLRVAGEQYAIAAHAVRGVAAVSRWTALPYAPPEVAGLIARGGEIIPAFHLRVVLGLPLGALPEYGRIVLVGDGADSLALVVDAVEHLGPIEPDELREPPEDIAPTVRAFLRGIDRRGIALIDHAALLASPKLFVEIPVPRESTLRPPLLTAPARKNPR